VESDNEYIARWSFALDLWIIFNTLLLVIGAKSPDEDLAQPNAPQRLGDYWR
jgi:lipopolysaccharide/colanic/teichoic acid biosynthesis glycosyltransferase